MLDTTILVADADPTARERTIAAIADRFPDANVLAADSLAAATDRLEEFTVDVVVTGHALGDGTGLELAARVRDRLPDAGCLLYSRQDDIDTDSFEDVVVEFVPKDAPDATELLLDLVEASGPANRQAAYPIPADEADRLAAVDRYTGETDRLVGPFSRLCALAVDQLAVDSAAVNVVGEHTQWRVAGAGNPPGEIDRADSICTYTLVHDGPVMEVEDTGTDHRFVDNETLAAAGVVAYLGAKITVDGVAVGTVCLHDDEPREFTDGERAFLERLATLAGDVFVLGVGGDPP